ncbi:TPA: S-type pyocin domain-containing protein [Klebsiella pneumoniae]|nr:S-type pyocin domain-containing protein [Klebsiella pneumoniae]
MQVETGTYGPSGYTAAANNGDVIIRFPASTGASPIYVSTIKVLDQEALNQRQVAENTLRNRVETAAKEEAARREEEARRAEELRRAEAIRKENYAKAGILDTPVYTPDMIKSANALLGASASMVLNRAPGGIQLSTVSEGVMTAVGEWAGSVAGALWRGAVTISVAVTEAVTLSTVGAFAVGFIPFPAGHSSDSRVPGRDLNMMAAQARLFTAGKTSIEPGMKSVNLPVRAFISMDSDGRQSLNFVKTGSGGVSSTVPVLKAIRDTATGLDKITVPAVAGAPSRTILVNPAPVGPDAPFHTGNNTPVPVTPVHTGTDIKQADSIVTTSFPAADIPPLQDFIYWQPDATGTGVEPIYVVLSDPLDSGKFTRRQLQKKYKHAIDFGISDTKINSETLSKFRGAIEAHLAEKDTVVKGTYRREKDSKVYYNPKTNNVVVLDKNGDFVSGWHLIPDSPQHVNFIKTGVL